MMLSKNEEPKEGYCICNPCSATQKEIGMFRKRKVMICDNCNKECFDGWLHENPTYKRSIK